MKTRVALIVLLAASFQALAQGVENDDMYFSKKDRVKMDLVSNNTRITKRETKKREGNQRRRPPGEHIYQSHR